MHVREALAEAAGKSAARYLESRGFRVLDRNWRHGDEMLSIVAAHRRALVVIDLRVSAGTRRSGPADVISPARKQLLRRLAGHWLTEHGQRADQVLDGAEDSDSGRL